ncbi:centrosomal protein of 89 kDa isoform X2 [Stegostoma tigrinum]|uniref:centrosomal protein of 89 kDa isoform X2 n=1 Tax=Stegostoma tigrinum TaxID=3053191 RepID=UPI00202B10C1|nr:centrosomal protein of 89 kDa isoform X2 [Stegostoma tigrinum]
MPFGWRRKDQMPFKHIAHGLVPAATIAPRAAVPRTPPPRSPEPSPERPRSALAAVILTSCLTGRTVAIPQRHLTGLRQRSYSESDGTFSEQQSLLEPYATVADLQLRNEWQSPVRGRPRLPLPSDSEEECNVEGEDDDQDVELLSDKADQPHYYVLEKEGDVYIKEPVYAIPHKANQNEIPASVSSDLTDISTYDVASTTLIYEPKPTQVEEHTRVHTSQEHQIVEKQQTIPEFIPVPGLKNTMIVEDPRTQSAVTQKKKKLKRKIISKVAKQDLTVEANRELTEIRKELLHDLKERNQALASENQVIAHQTHSLTKQLEGMKLKVERLEKENHKQQEVDNSQAREDEKAELHLLRQHAQELVDENDALKMTIHRLNVELSCYQTKFRPIHNEISCNTGLPASGPPPPWLVDMKFLSPLLLAYEDRLREKDAALQVHEEEMKNFRARVEEVVRENEQLHQQHERNGAVSSKAWNQLQDQAKLVLEENQVLMEQLEIQQAKAKSSHSRHIQEVSKLTKQLMLLESEKQSQEKELHDTQQELNKLFSKYDKLKATLDDRVRIDEHTAMVNDLKGKLQLEQEKHHVEVEELMGRIASLQAEKKSLLLEKTELIADNKTLEAELQVAQKSNRLAQKKIGLLKQQAEEAMEKEIAAHQYLANLIGLAEKTAHERDQLVHVTKSLTNEKHGVLNKIVAGNVRLGKLEEQVKMYKTKAAMKLGDMNNRMKEQEEDFARRTAQYQREIRRLQQLLKDKQETLDGLLEQQRQVESELETVWESTTRENRRIKDLLRATVHKNNLLDAASFDRSDIEGNPRRYLGSQSDFRAISYCDVILSSARRIEDRMTHENDLQLNINKHSPHRVAESGDCAITQQKKKKRREETVKSPMFESDSDQQQIVSSDESDKNEHDFYS